MPASIHDVAKRAGVSAATVSRILNHTANVNEKKAEAVREALEYYQYVPNQFGRGLVKQRSNMIGVYFPSYFASIFESPYSLELLKGISEALMYYDYSLVLINENADFGSRSRSTPKFLEFIRQKKVDGLIISGPSSEKTLIDIWKAEGEEYPLVYIGRKFHEKGINVYAQYEQYMLQLLGTIYGKGHRKVVLYTIPAHHDYLVDILKKAGEQMPDLSIASIEVYDPEYSRDMMKADIRRHILENGCTAICSSTMENIQGILNVCLELGIRVPEQVSILAAEHKLGAGKLLYPQISAFYVPAQDMGRGAAELLMKRIENREMEETSREYETRYVERESIRAI